jgi:tetratricopeptide (TPR) repeat protein
VSNADDHAPAAPRVSRHANAPAIDTAAADRLLEIGCYACLLDAFDTYQQALATGRATNSVRERAFATALLLGAREKEIGADAVGWIEQATRLSRPGDETYLTIVSALQWQQGAAAPDFQRPPIRRESIETWRTTLATDQRQPLLSGYLQLALACDIRTATADEPRRPAPTVDAPLLLRYRHGICTPQEPQELESVLAAEPRYAEAEYYLGRFEIAGAFQHRDWLTRAYPHFDAAHHGLRNSPVVAVTFAGIVRGRAETERALALYDEAIVLRPTDRDALLGRTVMLAELQRYGEAIATATRLLELGTWHVGDAYYWRAWSKYYGGHLDDAAIDVASATKLLVSTDAMTLSGIIAYDQRRKGDARQDFLEALRRFGGNCVASSYLGRIDADEAKWSDAATRFVSSAKCYAETADALDGEASALLRQPGMDPAIVRAGYDRQIAEARVGRARAALNAADSFARIGNRPQALEYARDAMTDARVAADARALITRLGATP